MLLRTIALSLVLFCATAISGQLPSVTHVNIQQENRILNTDGNCGYCSFETVCRFHGIKRGYGLASKNIGKGIGGHKGCIKLMIDMKLKHRYIFDKKNTDFLAYWVGTKKYPVIVQGDNHIVVLVHYSETKKDTLIKIINNTGEHKGLVKIWSKKEFFDWWSGRAYVVLPD